ncbi:hypothetical protein GCM10011376_13050 [Nocardioides flavus (ex Wang et al. 2016)]|uniref:DUF732 domain-containing protein n=1 Tax=Nocardioides flavus (ex Wang et al. 2016) TaxID=2058780 RepID=A0ABQ3HLI2_9ACTN|nr:hypothetical protein [Nocardioides flavus (ex Wang et al. 2016)]GHE16695.1 hypothetical protein GCM10011376_13050 [Nocardioides flavus (ex Wang et al. 2016)]
MRAPTLRSLVPAILLVPVLTACSGGTDSGEGSGTAAQAAQTESRALAEWRAALEDELDTDTFDFAALQQSAAADCARTDAASWTVELALSGDLSTSDLTRIGLEHACAEVVPAFDEAVAAVEQAADPLELVCGPGVELPAEAALSADLVCSNR